MVAGAQERKIRDGMRKLESMKGLIEGRLRGARGVRRPVGFTSSGIVLTFESTCAHALTILTMLHFHIARLSFVKASVGYSSL